MINILRYLFISYIVIVIVPYFIKTRHYIGIRLSVRANNNKSGKIKHYDWERLMIDTETRYTFITKVKTKYKALYDTTASLSASKRITHFETVHSFTFQIFRVSQLGHAYMTKMYIYSILRCIY